MLLRSLSGLRHPIMVSFVSSTLTQVGWLLIVSEEATLTREAGYVKGRVCELLNLVQIGLDNKRTNRRLVGLQGSPSREFRNFESMNVSEAVSLVHDAKVDASDIRCSLGCANTLKDLQLYTPTVRSCELRRQGHYNLFRN